MKTLSLLLCWMFLASCASSSRAPDQEMTIDVAFSGKVEKQVSAVYWDTSVPDAKRLERTQKILLSYVNSPSIDDRRGAAWVNAELSSALDPIFVRSVFESELADSDSGVRFIALSAGTTCTGYSEKFLVGSLQEIKALRKDPVPRVRQLARGVYSQAVKASKLK